MNGYFEIKKGIVNLCFVSGFIDCFTVALFTLFEMSYYSYIDKLQQSEPDNRRGKLTPLFLYSIRSNV